MSAVPPSFTSSRRWSIGFQVALAAVAALAILVMTNYLAARHYRRWVWTQTNPNQLTSITLSLLQSLASQSNQVKVVVLFDKHDPWGLYSSVSSLLKEYQLACPSLKVEYVDYERNPKDAVLIKERYKLSFPGDGFFKNMVIFDAGSRIKTVYEKELFDMDLSNVLQGQSKEVKRTNFKGELMFTSALINVTENRRFKILMVQGRGEHNPMADDPVVGYAKFGTLMKQMNLDWETISLSDREIPTNCNLLIIAGSQKRYEPRELEKIDKYLNQGGRLFLLFNYMCLPRTGLESLAANWGVRVGADVVLNMKPGTTAQESSTKEEIIITNFPASSHPIVKPLLRGERLHLLLPRTIEQQPGMGSGDAPKVEVLAASGANSVAVTDFRDGAANPDPFRDRSGPIPLLVAVEKGALQGIQSDQGSTRMVVAGDSLFLGNLLLDSLANRDFAVLAVNWLLDRSRLMGGIGPRPVQEYRILMSRSQMLAVEWILMAALPGAVMFIGLLVWLRRRS